MKTSSQYLGLKLEFRARVGFKAYRIFFRLWHRLSWYPDPPQSEIASA